MTIFPFVFSESWSGRCSSHYYLCKRESNWFFQALHDAGNQYLVPEAQWDKPWCFLLFKPSFSWYLDVCSPSLPWSQLCPLCHCKVSRRRSFRCIHINYLSSHRCCMGSAKYIPCNTILRVLSSPKTLCSRKPLSIFTSTLLSLLYIAMWWDFTFLKGWMERDIQWNVSAFLCQYTPPQQTTCWKAVYITCM